MCPRRRGLKAAQPGRPPERGPMTPRKGALRSVKGADEARRGLGDRSLKIER